MGIKTLAVILWIVFLISIYMFLTLLYGFDGGHIPVNKLYIVASIWALGGTFALMAVFVDCDTLAKVGLKTCPLTAFRVTLVALFITSLVGGWVLLKRFVKEEQ